MPPQQDSNPPQSLPELLIVMPVYNEEASVRKVVKEWFEEVQNWTENFAFLAVNDGSTDGTAAILQRLSTQLGPRFEILNQKNAGHGQACLAGYREACRRSIPFVMQIDSDGQCDPQYFFRLWRLRHKHDVVYGYRVRRDDGFRRVLASQILRLTILVFGHVWCIDANVPYRLMNTSALSTIINAVPPDFSLANIAVAILLRRSGRRAEAAVPIRFRERYGGEPSVRLSKFGEKAIELIRQIKTLP